MSDVKTSAYVAAVLEDLDKKLNQLKGEKSIRNYDYARGYRAGVQAVMAMVVECEHMYEEDS